MHCMHDDNFDVGDARADLLASNVADFATPRRDVSPCLPFWFANLQRQDGDGESTSGITWCLGMIVRVAALSSMDDTALNIW